MSISSRVPTHRPINQVKRSARRSASTSANNQQSKREHGTILESHIKDFELVFKYTYYNFLKMYNSNVIVKKK